MGKQSARLYYQGNDHRDIYFQGKYHDKMYKGNQLVWEKIYDSNFFIDYSYIYITSGFYTTYGIYRLNKYGVSKTPIELALHQDILANGKLYNNSYQMFGGSEMGYGKFYRAPHITSDFHTYIDLGDEYDRKFGGVYGIEDNYIYFTSAKEFRALVINKKGDEIEIFDEKIYSTTNQFEVTGGVGNYVTVLDRRDWKTIDKEFNVNAVPSNIYLDDIIGIIGNYAIIFDAYHSRSITTLTAINLSNYSQYPDYVIQEDLGGTRNIIYETNMKWICYVDGYLIYFDTRTGWRSKQFSDITIKVYNSYWKDRRIKITKGGASNENEISWGNITTTPLPTIEESGNVSLNVINGEMSFKFRYSTTNHTVDGYIYLDNFNFRESEDNYIYIVYENLDGDIYSDN